MVNPTVGTMSVHYHNLLQFQYIVLRFKIKKSIVLLYSKKILIFNILY